MTRVVLLRLVIHSLLTYIHGANTFPLLNGSSQSSDFDARSDAADSPKPSLSTGAIVGIVVTGTLAVITTSLAAFCCVSDARRRRVARIRSGACSRFSDPVEPWILSLVHAIQHNPRLGIELQEGRRTRLAAAIPLTRRDSAPLSVGTDTACPR